jgi:hypothetical protein
MKWSEALTKTTINEFIFDGKFDSAEESFVLGLRALCMGAVDTGDRVKEIRAAIKELPPTGKLSAGAREVVRNLKAELADIVSDLRFAKSRRGKYVLFVQDYVQLLYGEMRKDARFDDVFIGGHTEREIVAVTGRVRSDSDLQALKNILHGSPSGLPVEYWVKVTG